MACVPRLYTLWQLRGRSLALGERTVVMGILNVTPDSFSDGGLYATAEEAVETALQMFSDGAGIVDIGGESTRPGSYARPSLQQEADRVLPVIESILKERPESILSIDTYHAETARQAVTAGAEIVNDVSGFLWDAAMAETCAALACGVVLMHTRGRPEEWKTQQRVGPEEVVPVVLRELAERATAAVQAGVLKDRVVLDPGFGFGKVNEENYSLLARLAELRGLGYPLLAGVSRKGFLGTTLTSFNAGTPVSAGGRGNATIAASTAAILNGADIIRVHDVKEAAEAASIADAILAAS